MLCDNTPLLYYCVIILMNKYSDMSMDALYEIYGKVSEQKKLIIKKIIDCKKKLGQLDADYRLNLNKLNTTKLIYRNSNSNDHNESDTLFGSLMDSDVNDNGNNNNNNDPNIYDKYMDEIKNDYSNNKLMERMECDKHIYGHKKKTNNLQKPYMLSNDNNLSSVNDI